MIYIIRKRSILFYVFVCFILMLIYLAGSGTHSDIPVTRSIQGIETLITE